MPSTMTAVAAVAVEEIGLVAAMQEDAETGEDVATNNNSSSNNNDRASQPAKSQQGNNPISPLLMIMP